MNRKKFFTSSNARNMGYEMNEEKGGFYYPIYLTLAKANMMSESEQVNLWGKNTHKTWTTNTLKDLTSFQEDI